MALCAASAVQAQTTPPSCGSGGGATVCLTATGTASNIQLNWTVSGAAISNVQIYRDIDSDASGRTRLTSVSSSTTSYTDTTVTPSTAYWYWVKFAVGGDTSTFYNSGSAMAVRVGVMRNLTSMQLSPNLTPGWNLGNTLEAIDPSGGHPYTWGSTNFNETLWGNPKANQTIFNAVKAAGFKFVRIPVSWNQYADANNNISPQWMARVTSVVNYAHMAGLYVMINIHWDGGWLNHTTYDQQAALNAKLSSFWTQIANNFKNFDDYLLFSAQNETTNDGSTGAPTQENFQVQASFNQTFVNAVRATGGNNTNRHLIVPVYVTNIDDGDAYPNMPTDTVQNKLFREVHFYDPYRLTLVAGGPIWQWGAGATDPSAVDAWANESWVDGEFQKMQTRYINNNIPVILGEYGIMSKTDLDPNRTYQKAWMQYVTRSAFQHGLVPVWWDDGYSSNNTMGLFNRTTGAQYFPDLVSIIINASK
jgi:endoglucanase